VLAKTSHDKFTFIFIFNCENQNGLLRNEKPERKMSCRREREEEKKKKDEETFHHPQMKRNFPNEKLSVFSIVITIS
jgi:hypothetical protein